MYLKILKEVSLMRKLNIIKLGAIALIISMAMPTAVSATTFSDVPASHWAYSQIDKISNAGIMVGDFNGRFNPDNLIDKFETSKILAVMSGFKYTNRTSTEQTYYDSCVAKWKSFINQYHKFSKWKAETDTEIAFLLEKGIFVTTDLDQFVVLDANGKDERLRALSRQEVCVFLVRLMGRASAATSTAYTESFKDSGKINAASKPYVYYMKSLGIVNGDTSNNFNPDGAVTRAAMALMAQKTLDIINPSAPVTTPPVTTPTPASDTYETITGVVSKLYSSYRAIQVSSTGSTTGVKIYPVAANAAIKIDGYTRTFDDITEGMTISGVLSGTDLVSVTAVSPMGGASAPVTTPVTTPVTATPTTPVTNSGRTTIEGTVATLNFDVIGNYVGIEVRMLNPKGVIYTETRTFSIPSNATITRGGITTSYSAIVKGDIITAEVADGKAYVIKLEEKERNFTAELTNKKIIPETGVVILEVTDDKGSSSELTLTTGSYLYRKGVGVITWNELRIGDTLDIKSEYDKVVDIYSSGSSSTENVWVKDIFISNTEQCKITVTTADNKTAVYPLISGLVNPYDLRVGSRIKVYLDSKEVESFSVIQEAAQTYMTGTITSLTSSSITVRDTVTGLGSKEYTYDSSTIITDSTTGNQVSKSYLSKNMIVYVVTSTSSSSYAKTITILSY